MDNAHHDRNTQRRKNADATTRDENQHKQERQRADEQQPIGRVPSKGTDTPATMDADYAERERGKRTTM